MTVWQRTTCLQLLQNTLLFLAIFYLLYMLVDYSSHLSATHYHHSKLTLYQLFQHYSAEFSFRADILLPFALLVATTQQWLQMNLHFELVALQVGGYTVKQLLTPFLVPASLLFLLLMVNSLVWVPQAAKKLQKFSALHTKKRYSEQPQAHALNLADHSLLLYGYYDPSIEHFEDVYWIVDVKDLWKMSSLDRLLLKGYFVDHFILEEGQFRWQASFAEKTFPELALSTAQLDQVAITPYELSFQELLKESQQANEKGSRAQTQIYRRLTLPWLAFFAILWPIPLATRFGRHIPTLLIFALSLFGLVALYLFFNAACVLSDKQIMAPWIGLTLPMALLLGLSIYRAHGSL